MRRFLKAGNHKSTLTQSNRAWSLSGASWNYGRDDDPLPGGWKPQNKGRDMEGREDESLPTGWIPKCRLICEPTYTMLTFIHKGSFPPHSSTTFLLDAGGDLLLLLALPQGQGLLQCEPKSDAVTQGATNSLTSVDMICSQFSE